MNSTFCCTKNIISWYFLINAMSTDTFLYVQFLFNKSFLLKKRDTKKRLMKFVDWKLFFLLEWKSIHFLPRHSIFLTTLMFFIKDFLFKDYYIYKFGLVNIFFPLFFFVSMLMVKKLYFYFLFLWIFIRMENFHWRDEDEVDCSWNQEFKSLVLVETESLTWKFKSVQY